MLIGYTEARHAVRNAVLEAMTDLSEANKLALQAIESGDINGLEQARGPIKDIEERTEKIDNDIVLIFAKYTHEARDLIEHPVNRDRFLDLLAYRGELRFCSYSTGPYQVIEK